MWYFEMIKYGCFGDWLENNIDWVVSWLCYWGILLLLWCNDDDCFDVICVELLVELFQYVGCDFIGMDLYCLFIDEVIFI